MQPTQNHLRRVVHLNLESALDFLECPAGDGGCYALLWAHGAVFGCLDVAARELPLRGACLTEAIARALAPQVENREGLATDRPWPEVRQAWLAALPQRPAAPDRRAGTGPGISIVVCTRDRPEPLATCLARLMEVAGPHDEVIVVDNNPGDGRTRAALLAAKAHHFAIRYVPEPRPGLDVARNAGILASNRPIVAFVDDDVRIHPTWLERMAAAFEDPTVDAVTGLVLPETLQTEAQYLFERYWSFNKGFRPVRYDRGYLEKHGRQGAPVWDIGAGASMAFRRDALLRIGLFDDRLDVGAAGCSGDSELWYRILAAGGTCLYEPAVIAFHTHRHSMEGLRRQLRAYMRGHVVALLIQYERTGHRGNLRRALIGIPQYYAGLARQGLRTGWADRCRTLWDEVMGYFDGFRFYLTTPRPTPQPLRRAPAAYAPDANRPQ